MAGALRTYGWPGEQRACSLNPPAKVKTPTRHRFGYPGVGFRRNLVIGSMPAKDGNPPDLAIYGCDDERRVLAVTAVGGGAQIPSLSDRRGPASVEPRPLPFSSELDL